MTLMATHPQLSNNQESGSLAVEPKTLCCPKICSSSHCRPIASIREVDLCPNKANQLQQTNHWIESRRRGRGRSMLTTRSFWIRWFKSWTGSKTRSRASCVSPRPWHSLSKAMAISVRSPNQRRSIWRLKWLTPPQVVPSSLQRAFTWAMHQIGNSLMWLSNNHINRSWSWLPSCTRVQK